MHRKVGTLRSENQPDACIRLVVQRRQDGSAVGRVQSLLRTGEFWTEYQSIWQSGRPTPNQWELLQAQLMEAAQTVVVSAFGIQGVLMG